MLLSFCIVSSPANMSCQTITDAKNAQAAADQKAGTTSINAGNAGVGFFNTANVDSLLGEIVTASLAVTATGADATATAAAGAGTAAAATITPAATATATTNTGKGRGNRKNNNNRRYTPRRLWSA